MKWSFASVGLIAAGLVGIVIIILFQNITVNNEEDYHILKEVMEASMIDSIDLAYYRDTGKLKMVQEKFVENFTRRFAESSNGFSVEGYSLEFYDIMEEPAKASVIVKTDLGNYTIYGNSSKRQGLNATNSYGIANKLDGILEMNENKNPQSDECNRKIEYISSAWASDTSLKNNKYIASHKPIYIGSPLNFDHKVDAGTITTGTWEATKITFIRETSGYTDAYLYRMRFKDSYPQYVSNGYEVSDTDSSELMYYASLIDEGNLEIKKERIGDEYAYKISYDNFKFFADQDRIYDAELTNGKLKEGIFFYGIVFDVTWHNNACDK